MRILDPRHGRMFWIFHFYPMRGAPSAVRPILVLGDQSFQAHQAGVSEEIRTDLALLEVRQEDAIDAPGEQSGQVSLAHAQRQLANVFAIGDQDIESVELHLVIVLAAVQSVEVGSTVNSEQYRFAVDYKRGAPIAQSRFNDERILIRPVVAVAGEQANALPVPLDDQPIAIVLDLVKPRSEPWCPGSGCRVRTQPYSCRIDRHGRAECEISALETCQISPSYEDEERCPTHRPLLLPALRHALHGEPGTAAEAARRPL